MVGPNGRELYNARSPVVNIRKEIAVIMLSDMGGGPRKTSKWGKWPQNILINATMKWMGWDAGNVYKVAVGW